MKKLVKGFLAVFNGEAKRAAHKALSPQFRCSETAVELGCVSQENIDTEFALIAQHRAQLAQEKDQKKVDAYNYYLDRYEARLEKAQQAMNAGAHVSYDRKRNR